jgi:hypothetical protein
LIEKPLDEYLDENSTDKKGFYNFKSDMITKMNTTKQFYSNILEGLEKGLKNVS